MKHLQALGGLAFGLAICGCLSPASANTIALGFATLPSAQGFFGGTCGATPESALFSVDGTTLHQDTTSCDSQSGAGYGLANVVTNGHFTLTATMRVTSETLLREGQFGHFGLGFGAEAHGFEYFIGIGGGVIDAITHGGGNDLNDTTIVSTTADTTNFHTYEIDADGTGAFTLLLDGTPIFTGQGDPVPATDNVLFVGDDSSRAHAVGDVSQYVYKDDTSDVPEPATAALLGACLIGLGAVRKKFPPRGRRRG